MGIKMPKFEVINGGLSKPKKKQKQVELPTIVGMSNAIFIPQPKEVEQPKMFRKLRLRLLQLVIVAFFSILLVAGVARYFESMNQVEGEDYQMVEYFVGQGDTLWEIVQTVNEGRRYDVREYIHILQRDDRNTEAFSHNSQGQSILSSGTTIYVPQSMEVLK